MNIQTILDAELFELNEGIEFFKNSQRLSRLAMKMKKKLNTGLLDENQKHEVVAYINTLEEAAKEFADVEAAYKTGSKVEAKASFDKLKVKYFKLMRDLNTETMKTFIKGAGLAVIFLLLAKLLPFGKGPAAIPVASGGEQTIQSIQAQIAANTQLIQNAKKETDKLKAMSKNMELIEKLEKELARAQSKL